MLQISCLRVKLKIAMRMDESYKIRALRGSFGGDKRDRTVDLLRAMQALSQLSYITRNAGYFTPKKIGGLS